MKFLTRFHEKSIFLKNEQAYRKSTLNKLPLFFKDLQLFNLTFLSRTNNFAKIRKNSSGNMPPKPKSSNYTALLRNPCVALQNFIYHFVPHNLINKTSVLDKPARSIFFEKNHFFSQCHVRLKF